LLDPSRQRIVHVDVDPRNAGWAYPVELAITGDVADFLQMLAGLPIGQSERAGRLEAIAANNRAHQFGVLPATSAASGSLHYADVVRVLDRLLSPSDMLVIDAGTN